MKLRTLDNDIASMLHHAYAETETFTLKGSGITANFVAVRLNSEPCRLGTGRWYTYLDLEQVSEAEVDKPKEWDGEGLPHVGSVCEVFNNELSGPAWESCTILYSGKFRVMYDSESCYERVGFIDNLKFRPIRTPEKIEAEERERAIQDLVMLIDTADANDKTFAAAIYDAGYRKSEQ